VEATGVVTGLDDLFGRAAESEITPVRETSPDLAI
jgi:hypothetical protein